MVICLERGADLHVAQLMPLPLTHSQFGEFLQGLPMCFASVKSRLVPAYPGSPGQRAVKRLCVCVNLSKLSEQQLFSVSSHNLCRSGLRVTVCLENLKYQGICQLSWDFRGKIFLLLITVYCFLQVTTSVC